MTLDAQSLNLNARQILLKRLSTAQALAYTGPLGEVVIDTNLKLLRIQDGVTPGGVLMATSANIAHLQSQINSILNNIDPAALDSLSEVVANVNALLANNVESQLVNSGFYANLSNTGNLSIDGSLLPKTHLAQDLGSPTQSWRNLYISSSTAYFGNAAVSVTSNGLTVSMAGNVLPVIANVRFPDGTTQRTAVDMAVLANIYTLLTPNVSANLTTIHTDVTNAISYFGNLTDAAVSTLQANLQAQINYIKTNIDPAALDSLTEIVASFQNIDANIVSNIATLTNTVANLVATQDRLTSGNAQVVLNTSGPDPYVLFPAASTGEQLQLAQAEISSVSGNLALTSAEDALIIANGSGAVPGGSRLWRFDRTGGITLPNNAIIKDSTTNSISFGLRAGDSGQGTLTVAIGSQAGEINQGLQSTAVGSGAGNYNQGIGTVAIGTNAGAFNQGLRAVAIGGLAGSQNQGEYAVALGNFAGGTNQPNNSIIINASGTALNGSASGLFIDPIREVVGTKIVYYNSSTKEITTGPIGLTSNSNVSITSNNNVWTFGTTGNITFPDGTITSGKTITAPAEQDFTITLQHDMMSGDGLEPYSFVASYDKITLPTRNGRILAGPGNSDNEWSLDAANKYLFFPSGDRIFFNGNLAEEGADYGLHLFTYTKPVIITSGQTESWTFGTDGNLTLPQTAMDVSPAPVSWPGITFSDGTFQNTAYTGGGGAASTVDITNTNGLTTTYYPTFVESRTNGQYVRADVDLTYRTDDNLLRAGNIQVGRNIYGTNLGGISDAIQLRPNIDIDKRFLFTVDSAAGTYMRSTMEMPEAEVDKAVTLGFPHANGTVSYILNQGTDTNGTEWNDALVIFQNGGNVKIGTITNGNGTKIWEFNQTGKIRFPDASQQSTAWTGNVDTANGYINFTGSPAPGTSGITFADGLTQTTAYRATSEQKFDIKSTGFGVVVNTRYGVDTSAGAVIATLPPSPGLGDAVFFADAGGSFSTNSLTIARNGNTIMGSAADIVMNTNGDSLGLFWNGTTWRLYE